MVQSVKYLPNEYLHSMFLYFLDDLENVSDKFVQAQKAEDSHMDVVAHI